MLPKILKGKDNRSTKFGQLIEYNMTNIFLGKKYTQNEVEKLFPNPFPKKAKLRIYLDQ